jgi:hypothetical protein
VQNIEQNIDKSMSPPIGYSSVEAKPLGLDRGSGTGVFLGGRYSKNDLISYGGITEESQLGVPSSNRIRAHPNADATQMEHVQQQVSTRDPSSLSGKKHLNKFLYHFSCMMT